MKNCATDDDRKELTLAFMRQTFPSGAVLDLGWPPAGNWLRGYEVAYVEGDLDGRREWLRVPMVATCFEVLEHLLDPLTCLQTLPCHRLFATVPLSLWFAPAFRNPGNPLDWHFHEFERWQFDWLLREAGWEIVRREVWSNGGWKGVRPLLRWFWPRYYAVEALR